MTETLIAFAMNPHLEPDPYAVMFSGRSQTDPSHNMGPLIHHYYLIHYVISGRGHFRSAGKSYMLTAGDSFIIHPNELVQYTSDEQFPWMYCWVAFRGDRFAELLARMNITPDQPVTRRDGNRRIAPLYDRLIRTLSSPAANTGLLADGYLQLILGEYANGRLNRNIALPEPPSILDKHIDHAIRLLTLRYYQPISISELARELGYHRTHLSKIFKQRTGISPITFLMKIRMEQARTLMTTDLKIEQIAASVGFSDPLYFSKQFKKWYGIPPTEYRNRHN